MKHASRPQATQPYFPTPAHHTPPRQRGLSQATAVSSPPPLRYRPLSCRATRASRSHYSTKSHTPRIKTIAPPPSATKRSAVIKRYQASTQGEPSLLSHLGGRGARGPARDDLGRPRHEESRGRCHEGNDQTEGGEGSVHDKSRTPQKTRSVNWSSAGCSTRKTWA